ncbi:hypothetical protein PPYR_00658 [Photinus pyralis]|uniref:Adenosine deaminase domain-containing protein n=1 Tax=Photinus pyralis TaxID=7054 RepID=A0A5N4B2D6_PHOPY|nr:adenosine deaminase-like protein [Photinus pyralis]KAB0803688.1 hypothetical protein PPYR_00658 [Photinus pyralis]
MTTLLEFCQRLPKIELHAHLNGSLSERTLRILNVSEHNINLYQLLHKQSNAEERLRLAFSLFKVAHDATNTIDAVCTATKHVIEEYYRDNVIYLELRTTPREESAMSRKEYIEAVIKAITDQNLVVVKLLLSINRTHSLDESNESLETILEMHKLYPNIIKGLDLSGSPYSGHFYKDMFERARQQKLKITLHCAEIVNNEEVNTILQFKPDRIGHGTTLHTKYGGSQTNWELYNNLKIPLECCLTSNVLSGTVKSFKEHHVAEWIKHELPFSINTDDKGIFSTNLSNEYYLMGEAFNLSKEYIFNCNYKAIDYSFASDEEKEQIKGILTQWKSAQYTLF